MIIYFGIVVVDGKKQILLLSLLLMNTMKSPFCENCIFITTTLLLQHDDDDDEEGCYSTIIKVLALDNNVIKVVATMDGVRKAAKKS